MDICESSVSTASHYALQVAFNSLKNRCDKLQHRTAHLLNENHRLRYDMGLLAEKVDELEKQKQQLNQHILNVTTENTYLSQKYHYLDDENERLKSRLNPVEHKNYDESSRSAKENVENNEVSDMVAPEDDDSDVSIVTVEESESAESIDSIGEDLVIILDRLKVDKFMLQQFQDSLVTSLREISSQANKGKPLRNQEGLCCNDFNFKLGQNHVDETEANENSLNVTKMCRTCKNPIFPDIKEVLSDLLLHSFEIITCKCNI